MQSAPPGDSAQAAGHLFYSPFEQHLVPELRSLRSYILTQDCDCAWEPVYIIYRTSCVPDLSPGYNGDLWHLSSGGTIAVHVSVQMLRACVEWALHG